MPTPCAGFSQPLLNATRATLTPCEHEAIVLTHYTCPNNHENEQPHCIHHYLKAKQAQLACARCNQNHEVNPVIVTRAEAL